MITFGVAILLSMAATAADPVDDARKTYNNCMLTAHNDGVNEKTSESAFGKIAETACETEKLAYRSALVSSEIKYGSSRKEAETYADEEIEMIVDSIKAAYAENLDKRSTLSLEK